MKKTILKSILFFIVILLSGCGSGTDSTKTVITMALDQNYTIESGDVITTTSDDANVTVTLQAEDGTRIARLVSGTAIIEQY
ncbi:MAG: hypothetical protein PHF17_00105 [Arcobacteraceae bacterium]|nr:hypothetical protein [Arcobacteraceae bacterium]